ncbi:hypothetical protein QCA50_018086 [Cerrena zonata]|uniref:Uncharacterized protein n=1 Tax=Cerrena zonata TaxID=2478898 RepID=A0AAW0FNJ2_9APHY
MISQEQMDLSEMKLGLYARSQLKYERSSAQRKELFREIQQRSNVVVVKQLILDMKIRRSSTYAMLHRSEPSKKFVDTFVCKMALCASNAEERRKIDNLKLTFDEWEQGLHKAWSVRAEKKQYEPFSRALKVACHKISEYYDKTGNTDAYVVSIFLNPCQKGAYFKKYWSSTLETEALTSMEDVVLVFINAPDLIPISI